MPQYARPAADVSTGGWSDAPLYAALAEAVPDDADLAVSSPDPAADAFEVKLSEVVWPGDGDVTVRVRLRKTDPAALPVRVDLVQGATVVATRSVAATTAFATYAYTLTAGERAAVTDYADLRLRVTAG